CARSMLGANAIPSDNASPARCFIAFSFCLAHRQKQISCRLPTGLGMGTRCKWRSTAVRCAPALELLARLRSRRIDAEDRAPLLDLLLHEILERGLLERFLRDLLGEMLRDDDDTLVIADDDISRIDRYFAAGDGNVKVDRVMLDQVGGCGRRCVIGGERDSRDVL